MFLLLVPIIVSDRLLFLAAEILILGIVATMWSSLIVLHTDFLN